MSARKISRAGIEAARRKFMPEFMNRIDKVVMFKALSQVELRKILGLELNRLQHRILSSSTTASFVFELTEVPKEELLREGTDVRYGARHLNRAIDRSLVHPLSNLIATRQVRDGDWVEVDFDCGRRQMTFSKKAEGISAYAMLQMTEASPYLPPSLASTVAAEIPGTTTPGRRAPTGSKERNLAA